MENKRSHSAPNYVERLRIEEGEGNSTILSIQLENGNIHKISLREKWELSQKVPIDDRAAAQLWNLAARHLPFMRFEALAESGSFFEELIRQFRIRLQWMTSFLELLSEDARIAGAITWEDSDGSSAYPQWSQARKDELLHAFNLACTGHSVGLADPPANMWALEDADYPQTTISAQDAWPLFLAYVSQSLRVEVCGLTYWSIRDYPGDWLEMLLSGKSLFSLDRRNNGYFIDDSKTGFVLPSPPQPIYRFLSENGMIGAKAFSTIGRSLEWCRQHLVHFRGGFQALNMQDQWQYRGWPPVSRMLEGTPHAGVENILSNRTAGCHGTTGFLRCLLRTVNIPVEYTQVICDAVVHAVPAFVTENRYLSHGDDPYNQAARCTPPYGAWELLINQQTFESWFGSSVEPQDRRKNIGRRVVELALKYLPDNLLRLYCNDQVLGINHENSSVLHFFEPHFTQEQLDEQRLWERLQEKVDSFGGCGRIP
jgi:hypothetical protein